MCQLVRASRSATVITYRYYVSVESGGSSIPGMGDDAAYCEIAAACSSHLEWSTYPYTHKLCQILGQFGDSDPAQSPDRREKFAVPIRPVGHGQSTILLRHSGMRMVSSEQTRNASTIPLSLVWCPS
jgi:hypothetical protein